MEIRHMVKTPTAMFKLKYRLKCGKTGLEQKDANYSHAIGPCARQTPPPKSIISERMGSFQT
jgi:hypothetical protein